MRTEMRLSNWRQNSVIKEVILAINLLAFVTVIMTLWLVQPSPLRPMGFFSYELLTPITFWVMLVALTVTSVFLVESESPFALLAILLALLAVRLPLFLMFKIPYGFDSYLYMNFIQGWHSTGSVSLSIDQATRAWPASFLMLYALRQAGISETVLWTAGTLVVYVVNAILLYLVFRISLNRKAARYALLVVSLAPTFNFYYSTVMSPQLVGATIFLMALLALSCYRLKTAHKTRYLFSFVGLFALLLFTHALTSLLLAVYVFILPLEGLLSRLLKKIGVSTKSNQTMISSPSKFFLLAGSMFTSVAAYLAVMANNYFRFVLTIFGLVITGRASTYQIPQAEYTVRMYAFNTNSLFVYGLRLLPLALSTLLVLFLLIRQLLRCLRTKQVSTHAMNVVYCAGLLTLVSFFLLKGLILEVPRLFDLTLLFVSIIVSPWFVLPRRSRSRDLFRISLLLAILTVSSTLGMAVQSSEFVYYQQEKQAVTFVAHTYPTGQLYTDARLLSFARFYASNMVVMLVPPELSGMLPNRSSTPVLLLISYHSLEYNQYRPLFVTPSEQVLDFALLHGRVVYSAEGVTVYSLS